MSPDKVRTKYIEELEASMIAFIKDRGNKAPEKSWLQTKLRTFIMGRADPTTGLVPRSIPVSEGASRTVELNKYYDLLWRRVHKQLADADKAKMAGYREAARLIFDRLAFDKLNIIPIIKKAAYYLGTLMTIDFAVTSARELCDLWLVNVECQDNVVVTPLFFRGEPFLAGLEGMKKNEGERYGMLNLLTGRLQSVYQAMTHSITDPIASAYYNWLREKARAEAKINPTHKSRIPAR